MRNTFIIALVALLAVFATGCNHKKSPSASDTVLRSSYSDSSDYANADSVNGSDSLAAQGLMPRATDFGSITAENLERGILPSVYFDFDRATINASERSKLQQAADYLKTNSSRKVLVEGHCDWRGTTEYNLGLGDRRARAAKDFLVTLGIEESRIGTVSKGDLEAVQNGSEEQMAQDRRADLLLLKQ